MCFNYKMIYKSNHYRVLVFLNNIFHPEKLEMRVDLSINAESPACLKGTLTLCGCLYTVKCWQVFLSKPIPEKFYLTLYKNHNCQHQTIWLKPPHLHSIALGIMQKKCRVLSLVHVPECTVSEYRLDSSNLYRRTDFKTAWFLTFKISPTRNIALLGYLSWGIFHSF